MPDPVTLIFLALVAALVIGMLAYVLVTKRSASRRTRESAAIRSTIIEYFRRSGVAVGAECVILDDGLYTVMVESEPMKRFRLSHIIEMTLREHVRKTCRLELGKIYWRFPIKEVAQAGPAAPASTAAGKAEAAPVAAEIDTNANVQESADDYINEGLEHYRHIPKAEATELPWETFEEVSTGGLPPKDPPAT